MTDHAVNEWTREDLPSVIKSHRYGNMHFSRIQEIEAYKDDVVDHLNAHHPKPPRGGHDAQIAQLVRMCNEAGLRRTRAETERDAAVAPAEQAERERDEWQARAEKAERAAGHLRKILNTQKGRVADVEKKHPAPAVSRADIEKAISELRTFPRFLTDELLVLRDDAIDAVCDLFGAEAEPADPVEELAGQIESATRSAIRQACVDLADVAPSLDPLAVEQAMEVTAASRKVAAHVLGQEAGDE